MRYFILSVVPLAALAVAGAVTAARAAQDTPFTANGVTAVCTGVGSAKDDPQWSAYPVKIVLANSGGANLAGAHVTVARGSDKLLEADCDAPWVLIKAPAGQYTATATLIGGSGQSHSTSFSGGASRQKELTLLFTPPRQQVSAQ